MIKPEDLQYTEKMLAAIGEIEVYQSHTSWTLYGERQEDECWRCEPCGGLLTIGPSKPTDDRIAQHLVTDHGYTYDGLSPEEMKELCSE